MYLAGLHYVYVMKLSINRPNMLYCLHAASRIYFQYKTDRIQVEVVSIIHSKKKTVQSLSNVQRK